MKHIKVLTMGVLAISSLAVFLYGQNNWLSFSSYELNFPSLPKAFDGYKIVHLSDLHNKSFGEQQKRLVEAIREQGPDIIVITGDLVDRRKYREEISLELVQEVVKIAPVYFVTGNHEWWSGRYQGLREKLLDHGIVILEDEHVAIQKGQDNIYLIGIDDAAKFLVSYGETKEKPVVAERLKNAFEGIEEGKFKILLAHRPEKIMLYEKEGAHLVLSGHTHGGQWRIPGVGGVLAPGQGFFPKYLGGLYREKRSTMVVSRGLGNSIIPLRLFNRPEIVTITLTR